MLQVTQRLDHVVPDQMLTDEANEMASRKLDDLSRLLIEHVPNPALSPEERLERIARVNQERTPQREHLLPAAEKLYRLERRLDDLVDNPELESREKLEVLIENVSEVGERYDDLDVAEILVRMGDERAGLEPVRE